MRKRNQAVLEAHPVTETLQEHPVTETFLVMFDELAEYCEEVLELKKKMNQLDRRSEEFYQLMARLETIFMAMRFTAKHLEEESERMDEMFEED
jgi:hypothetical protein